MNNKTYGTTRCHKCNKDITKSVIVKTVEGDILCMDCNVRDWSNS